ncbi:hypothetical protein J6590_025001 [Homalodisca vitripennis]|nr:hypothetical protein J6590_025001 [Homalodisca vitripennis]
MCGCVPQWPLRRLNGLQSAEKETATVILVMDRSQCGHQNTATGWQHWLACTQCAAAAEWITKRGERNSDSNLSNGPVAVWPPEHCYWLATLAGLYTMCGCVPQWPLRRLNGLQSAEKETATVILVMDRSQCGHHNTATGWQHWLVCTQPVRLCATMASEAAEWITKRGERNSDSNLSNGPVAVWPPEHCYWLATLAGLYTMCGCVPQWPLRRLNGLQSAEKETATVILVMDRSQCSHQNTATGWQH